MSLDWATLANVAVVLSVFFIVWQLREMQRTTQAQTYLSAVDRLQAEEVRQARRAVFRLKDKPLEDWTAEDRQSAEIVGHTYDVVGQMVRYSLLKRKFILENWGHSLRDIWPILRPLIKEYREDWHAPKVWDDFEWLAGLATKETPPPPGPPRRASEEPRRTGASGGPEAKEDKPR